MPIFFAPLIRDFAEGAVARPATTCLECCCACPLVVAFTFQRSTVCAMFLLRRVHVSGSAVLGIIQQRLRILILRVFVDCLMCFPEVQDLAELPHPRCGLGYLAERGPNSFHDFDDTSWLVV